MGKRTLKMVFAALLLACGTVALPAWAEHGGVRFGIGIGVPLWPWYYPPAYAYPPAHYPAPMVVVQPPPVYVQQEEAAPAEPARQTGSWYYCESANGYYPYVRECPSGWRQVGPQPAAPR